MFVTFSSRKIQFSFLWLYIYIHQNNHRRLCRVKNMLAKYLKYLKKCAVSRISVYYFTILSCCLYSGIQTIKRSKKRMHSCYNATILLPLSQSSSNQSVRRTVCLSFHVVTILSNQTFS